MAGTCVFATAGGGALAFASEPLSDLAVCPPLDDPVAFDVFVLLLLWPLKFGAAKEKDYDFVLETSIRPGQGEEAFSNMLAIRPVFATAPAPRPLSCCRPSGGVLSDVAFDS